MCTMGPLQGTWFVGGRQYTRVLTHQHLDSNWPKLGVLHPPLVYIISAWCSSCWSQAGASAALHSVSMLCTLIKNSGIRMQGASRLPNSTIYVVEAGYLGKCGPLEVSWTLIACESINLRNQKVKARTKVQLGSICLS